MVVVVVIPIRIGVVMAMMVIMSMMPIVPMTVTMVVLGKRKCGEKHCNEAEYG